MYDEWKTASAFFHGLWTGSGFCALWYLKRCMQSGRGLPVMLRRSIYNKV